MNNEQQQADLLQDYLRALAQDIDALPPDGLDPGMGAFARKLARQNGLRSPSTDVKARIWQRALNSASQISGQDKEFESMLQAGTYQKQNRPLPILTLAAAAAAMLLIAAMVVVALNMGGPGDDIIPAGLQSDEIEQDQNTTPTLVPTATGSSVPQGDMFLTATAIIGEATRRIEPTLVPTVPPMPIFLTATAIGVDLQGDAREYVPIVTSLVDIPAGTTIREEMLIHVLWPADRQPAQSTGLFEQVVGQVAQQDIARFSPVLLPQIVEGFSEIVVSYEIREGDNLFAIMNLFDMTIEQFAELNPDLCDPNSNEVCNPLIFVGQSVNVLLPEQMTGGDDGIVTATVTPSATWTMTATPTRTATHTPTPVGGN